MKTCCFVILFISLRLFAFAQIQENAYDLGKPSRDAVNVSIVSLLANPKANQGKPVRVIGFMLGDGGGSYLFLTRDHARLYDRANAIQFASKINGKYIPDHFIDNYVMIEGILEYDEDKAACYVAPITRIAVRPIFGQQVDKNRSENEPNQRAPDQTGSKVPKG